MYILKSPTGLESYTIVNARFAQKTSFSVFITAIFENSPTLSSSILGSGHKHPHFQYWIVVGTQAAPSQRMTARFGSLTQTPSPMRQSPHSATGPESPRRASVRTSSPGPGSLDSTRGHQAGQRPGRRPRLPHPQTASEPAAKPTSAQQHQVRPGVSAYSEHEGALPGLGHRLGKHWLKSGRVRR